MMHGFEMLKGTDRREQALKSMARMGIIPRQLLSLILILIVSWVALCWWAPSVSAAPQAYSVEAIGVGMGPSSVIYSIFGHKPDIPRIDQDLPPSDWTWWTPEGSVMANITTFPEPVYPLGADVAFDREGDAIAIWGWRNEVTTGTEHLEISSAWWSGKTEGWSNPATVYALDYETGPDSDTLVTCHITDMALAIDSSGWAIAVWNVQRWQSSITDQSTIISTNSTIFYSCNQAGNSWRDVQEIEKTPVFSETYWHSTDRYTGGPLESLGLVDIVFTSVDSEPTANDPDTKSQAIVAWTRTAEIGGEATWSRLSYSTWNRGEFSQALNTGVTFASSTIMTVAMSSDKHGCATMVMGISGASCEINIVCSWWAEWNGNKWTADKYADHSYSPTISFNATDGGISLYTTEHGINYQLERDNEWHSKGVMAPNPGDERFYYNTPLVASLAHQKTLAVWKGGNNVHYAMWNGSKWSQISQILNENTTVNPNIDASFDTLAAKTGSPSMPLAEWTYFVYLDGDNNLGLPYSYLLNHMKNIGSTNLVNVVVLYDNKLDDTRLYYVKRNSKSNICFNGWVPGELDMGDPSTLTHFINWTVENYPANRYFMVLEDHGGGAADPYGTLMDESSHSSMSLTEQAKALRDAGIDKRPFEIIGLYQCMMGMVETLYQYRSFTEYLVASQHKLYIDGWASKYGRDDGWGLEALRDLVTYPHNATEKVANVTVNHFSKYYKSTEKGDAQTLSVMRTSEAEGLKTAIDKLANALQEGWRNTTAKVEIRKAYQCTQKVVSKGREYFYLDLYNFTKMLMRESTLKTINLCAYDVGEAFNRAKVHEWHIGGNSYGQQNRRPFFYGLSIYMPININKGSFYAWEYNGLEMSLKGSWDEFIRDDFIALVPTGSTVELACVSKLFLGIEDRLGRVIELRPALLEGTKGSLKDAMLVEINESIYSDFGNGTILVYLPRDVTEYMWTVDATFLEEEKTNYCLMITTYNNGDQTFEKKVDGVIRRNTTVSGAFSVPQVIQTNITWGNSTYPLTCETNASISNLTFNQPSKQLSFSASGPPETMAFINVTIPKELLGPPFNVSVGDEEENHVLEEMGLSYGVCLKVFHPPLTETPIEGVQTVRGWSTAEPTKVKITAATVIREIPADLLASLFVLLLLTAPLTGKVWSFNIPG